MRSWGLSFWCATVAQRLTRWAPKYLYVTPERLTTLGDEQQSSDVAILLILTDYPSFEFIY